jgi:hypothetical protein
MYTPTQAGETMRISKASLHRKWFASTLLAALIFAVLAMLDLQLKLRTGAGTADLQGFTSASQYLGALFAWREGAAMARAGFNLGLDYLLMPVYAASLFYSGVIVMEGFAPKGTLRRLLSLAALAPVVAAGLDVLENALQLHMLWNGPTDALAGIARTVSSAKWMGLIAGLGLLVGAVLARVTERRKRRLHKDA